ncbi:hypothetical protein HanRHA438_Chr14g0653811 [Helianthus annuus]|nr:hypothetical protein HanHA89_Chr14g0570951 [Helianthus annuus]KAJ0656226.1 hypothetical protein HanLR1_Chr14g0533351 [Helianthus annuus]KAJ0853666.1 hypothetical protein HanRHA438_Chr14g0653811 [Helianthus annuus]
MWNFSLRFPVVSVYSLVLAIKLFDQAENSHFRYKNVDLHTILSD